VLARPETAHEYWVISGALKGEPNMPIACHLPAGLMPGGQPKYQ